MVKSEPVDMNDFYTAAGQLQVSRVFYNLTVISASYSVQSAVEQFLGLLKNFFVLKKLGQGCCTFQNKFS